MIRQTSADDAKFVGQIYELTRSEMNENNLAIKDRAQISREIIDERSFIAVDENSRVFGYVSFHEWHCGIEIMSLVVRSDRRRQGLGSALVAAIVDYARSRFPGKDIIAMANHNSAPIIVRNGFASYSKFAVADELQEACAGCQEEKDFPNCHCQPLIYLKPGLIRIAERGANQNYDNQLLDLYCRIWREPPWNEFFWTPARVSADLISALAQPKAVCLIALNGETFQGFTWGHYVDAAELRFIAGHDIFDVFYDRKLFYISELGVDARFRGQGTGKKLTQAIINFARGVESEIILLRTDKDALPAQSVYKKCGFVPLFIPDAKHPSRLYWAFKFETMKK